jgi:NAD(P)-dependent dehydrogenase (short-subunit alcohol dehydrogenase family)
MKLLRPRSGAQLSAPATALILGATAGIGQEVATALKRHGWQINALHRDPAKRPGAGVLPKSGVHSLQGELQ